MAGGKRNEQAHPSNGSDRPSSRYDRVQEEETDHINVEMQNIDEEQELQHPSPNGNARGQEEEPEPRSSSIKRIEIIFIAILLIIICILAGFLFKKTQKTEAVQTGTSVPLNCQKDPIKYLPFTCLPDWTINHGNCYKLSEEEKNWNESQNSCILHNATLAKITKEEIMSNGIMRMFTKVHVFWIGLTREPNQHWKWLDGENATMEVKGNGGDCAYLDEEVTAMSVRCSTEHYYMCKKPMLLRDPEREPELLTSNSSFSDHSKLQ